MPGVARFFLNTALDTGTRVLTTVAGHALEGVLTCRIPLLLLGLADIQHFASQIESLPSSRLTLLDLAFQLALLPGPFFVFVLVLSRKLCEFVSEVLVVKSHRLVRLLLSRILEMPNGLIAAVDLCLQGRFLTLPPLDLNGALRLHAG